VVEEVAVEEVMVEELDTTYVAVVAVTTDDVVDLTLLEVDEGLEPPS
jgi:hypothetical protein